ncbi:MAG: GNAT family N-acetyltransferase [Anaerolineales bacterium]|nr:GNAT family N-acetyltransferase [Anaerolineales bacterium]
MGKIEIRKLSLEEAAPIFSWLTSYSFTPNPPTRTAESFAERFAHTAETNTYLALLEDDQAAASAGTGPMTQNVRGKIVDSAGIFMVATHPAQRRKGYAFQLLKELFKQIRDEGVGFSTLYPFRESFYERLGYTTWFPPITAEINIRSLAPLLSQDFGAELAQHEFINSVGLFHEFLAIYQQHTHGMATFVKNPQPDPERDKAWVITSRINGKLDGIMVYSLQGDNVTKFKFNIYRFYYFSPATRYQFLQWIAHHIDQASEVCMVLPPYEQPQTWLSDLEVNLGSRRIGPMGRVLDIDNLNGLPVGDGQFSVQINDPTCPWNEGAWQFTSQAGKLSVTRAGKAACTLSIQGISSLVFGNIPPEDYQYRGWGDVPVEVQKQMTSLFPAATPHLHEYF